MNYTAFKFMGDDDLAERVEKLQRKVEALSQANTTIALRMLEEFTAALEAAKGRAGQAARVLTIYATMTDTRLAKLETQILVRIMQLRPAVSPTTKRLLEQCEAELADVRAEQQRRLTP